MTHVIDTKAHAVWVETDELPLMHYHDERVELNREWPYPQNGAHGGWAKPYGLWVSVEGEQDWPSWCKDEEFDLEALNCEHRVTLRPDSNVLWLSSAEDIMWFHKKYSVEDQYRTWTSGDDRFEFNQRKIDWGPVTKDFDGIIIAPYQWDMRCGGPMWYWGWDCASGCIWNMDAIAELERVDVLV